jgi:hypothetical protein
VATDSSGNIYVTGFFQGTVNFGLDFGVTDNKTSAGGQDIFITKINADGTYGWTKIIGGTGADRGYDIVITSYDDIFVVGNFTGTVDFGLDFGTTENKTPQGGYGAFVTKINANGTYGWTKIAGGAKGTAITVDSYGDIFAAGYFYDTYNFGLDFGVTDNKTSAGNADIFILKINAEATYGWTRRIGGIQDDQGWGLAADSSGTVFLTGSYRGTFNFGLDFGATDNKTAAGESDIFITKFHNNGFYQGTKSMGGTDYDGGFAIASTPSGDIAVTGYYRGTVNFRLDFGGTDNKTSAGGFDIFVTKINAGFSYGWTKVAGGSGWDWGLGITLDSSGNIYTAGMFTSTVNFGLDFGTTDNKTAAGNNDIFISRINANGTYGWTKIFGGSYSETGQGIAIDASGNIYGTGYFEGTVNFGLDFGTTDQKTVAGGDIASDIYLLKIKANRGYYVLDGYGGIHAGGNAQAMTPATPYFGFDIAKDLELAETGYYVLDGYGGVHAGGGASEMSPAAPYFGWNIARDMELATAGYYVLDGYGGVHAGGGASVISPAARYFGWDIARDLELTTTTRYYVLDGYGGIHGGGGAPAMSPAPPYFGWNIARDLELATTGLYVLDGYGGIHAGGGASAMSPATPYFGFDIAKDLELAPVGYYVLDGYGGIYAGGGAKKIIPPTPYFGWNIARALALYLR